MRVDGKDGGTRIFLVRHGKPEFPDDRSYIYGQTDFPLSKAGRKQAKKLGKALSSIPMQRIISSDLARAMLTADIVAKFQDKELCRVERDPSLREINMGEWDGVAKEDVEEGFTDIFRMRGEDIVRVSAPGGENFLDLQERGSAAFERITESSEGLENILIVAHGGIIWSIVSKFFDIPLGDLFRFGLDHCGLHLIEHCGKTKREWGKYRLIRYNWSPELANYMQDLT
jgi:broad specificity phosphatase PhoE